MSHRESLPLLSKENTQSSFDLTLDKGMLLALLINTSFLTFLYGPWMLLLCPLVVLLFHACLYGMRWFNATLED